MAKDKWLHFLAGMSIALVVGVLWGALAGLAAAFIIGAAKELIWDLLLKKGTPEFLDFVATAAGGVIGAAVIRLIG